MNSIHPSNPSKTWRLPVLIGFLLGICVAVAALYVPIQDRSQALTRNLAATAAAAHPSVPTAPPAQPSATATLKPAPSATPTLAPTLAAEIAVDDAILKVEAQIGGDDKPGAQSALLALLASERDPQAVARIFSDLSELEAGFGHIHLASGYSEQAYALRKTPKYLLKLAESELLANQYEQARMRYMELVNWQGLDADPYREEAQSGLDMVNTLLGAGG
jgi:hypothetical protein